MTTKSILIVEPETEQQIIALEGFMEKLKIKFKVKKDDTYNQNYVETILNSKKQIKTGKITQVNKEDFKNFLGV